MPPEGLLRAGEGAETSPDAPWAIKSAPGGTTPRQEATLCALGVRCDFGDILGGPGTKGVKDYFGWRGGGGG